MTQAVACPGCNGTGYRPEPFTCPVCKGDRVVTDTAKARAKIARETETDRVWRASAMSMAEDEGLLRDGEPRDDSDED